MSKILQGSRMKVLISGSYKNIDRLEQVARGMEKFGFSVRAPDRATYEIGDNKTRRILINDHLEYMKDGDIFLIGNVKEPDQKYGRVGTSTYFETGWAYALGKPIYALEMIDPNSEFAEDLLALGITIIDGDYKKIRREK